MTKADARPVTTMHLKEHGIEGMAGSLDCMHVKWKNCPVAWQGQYQGKEGCPTIVMEAFCDYNRWFWHAAFNFPELLNDINIWGQSPLRQSFIDGTFSDLDFDFDGIYP